MNFSFPEFLFGSFSILPLLFHDDIYLLISIRILNILILCFSQIVLLPKIIEAANLLVWWVGCLSFPTVHELTWLVVFIRSSIFRGLLFPLEGPCMLDCGYFPPDIFVITLARASQVLWSWASFHFIFFRIHLSYKTYKFRSTSMCGKGLGSNFLQRDFSFPHVGPHARMNFLTAFCRRWTAFPLPVKQRRPPLQVSAFTHRLQSLPVPYHRPTVSSPLTGIKIPAPNHENLCHGPNPSLHLRLHL